MRTDPIGSYGEPYVGVRVGRGTRSYGALAATAPARRRAHMNDRIRPHSRRTAGQSLVEFAVLLPVMLTLFGAAVDVARVYQAWITLEASTRDAAEYVATYDTTATGALSDATTRICTQMVNIPGRTGSADPAVCTQPAVTAT